MKVAGILNRKGRALLLIAVFPLLATIVPPRPLPRLGPAVAALSATPVRLDDANPARRTVGELRFLRGWVLASDDPRFGGISAMRMEEGRLFAVSDAGYLFVFGLPDGRAGRVRILPFVESDDKTERDTETLSIRGGDAWVAFERINAVARFRRGVWREEARTRPPAMRRWPFNRGAEAMARLPDGRFLALAEGEASKPFSEVVLFAGDPAEPATPTARLRYRRLPGFRVTDAAALPDGRLFTLNRRFTLRGGFSAALAVADTAGLRAGATIEPREIAALRAPLTVDNMEALSVTVEGGRTILRIASDDNFMAFQRTLLLEFALEESPSRARRPGSRTE